MGKSHRTERAGRRPVIAVPVLSALAVTSAIFTLASVAGADGRWSRIQLIFVAFTVLVACIALACLKRGHREPAAPEPADPEWEQFLKERKRNLRREAQTAPTPAPASTVVPEPPLTGTIVGTDVHVEVAQAAAS